MEFPLMIRMDGVIELICKGVVHTGKRYSMEGDVVPEAPIPKEDGLYAEGPAPPYLT